MAAHNVCRYFKFGYCKFAERCRFHHVKEECTNRSCDISVCTLRHPRICKFFRDYNRCKFGEWCFFKHMENNSMENVINKEEIMEKLDNLKQLIDEKDALIKDLAEKIRVLEENTYGKEDTINENEESESEMDKTFLNPYLVNKGDSCNFVAKTPGGFQVHVRAIHKVVENSNGPEITILEENIVENSVQCDKCDFSAQSEKDLNEHKLLKHESENKEIEIKLDVFTLVDFDNDVLKARKLVMEKLEEQEGVNKVKTAYVSKGDTFFDKDNLRWNTIDIVLTTKKSEISWKDKNFKRSIFFKVLCVGNN